jgi:hypothetical protein
MQTRTWMTLLVLAIFVAGLLAALLIEASSGPTFRAEDHANYAECVRAIPEEWRPGSIEQTGAEAACRFVHQPRP